MIQESEFFDAHMSRIEADPALFERAEAKLSGAATAEPLIAESLRAPQDIRYHAEGPFVRDHLRLILMSLYAIAEGKLRLLDIEELARLKEYAGEIETLEELLREHVSWFEAFALVHDSAKWNTLVFKSPEGSRGAELGFNAPLSYEPDVDLQTRAELRERYLELYRGFEAQHPNESAREVQSLFYLTYEIDVKYPHHDRILHTPVYSQLLERFARAHELTDIHTAMLEDVVTQHLAFKRFNEMRTSDMSPFFHLARVRGYDLDAFMAFLKGALFLDFVCGSKRLSDHGYWHEVEMLANALRAEHEVDPARRAQREHLREQSEQRRRLRVFQQVGLDGLSLMELLGMEPGPEFGRTLREVQGAIVGERPMPVFGKKVNEEISRRAGEYYQKVFEKGE
ncbi:hypothetical protein HZA85_02185 [Candidatus Uhrbacteria bacterium]|nr:hypothetical protein [Candidatus Uhrbacteria bacterium]